MTTLTQEQARLEILGVLQTAWDAGPVSPVPLMIYDHNSASGFDPDPADRWARAVVDPSDRFEAALGGKFFRTVGLLKVQIFVPKDEGMSNIMALAKVAIDAFEGKHSASGIWFRNARYRNVGQDAPWFAGLVLVEYIFDEAT